MPWSERLVGRVRPALTEQALAVLRKSLAILLQGPIAAIYAWLRPMMVPQHSGKRIRCPRYESRLNSLS
jgi:hypothetical protein